ncbi:MAG: 4Fe-4S dicluster domain-containing protein [Peptococcaceae bacterium]|jgi:iron only hydrogenase large subunit-like protein/uncharacterized Fe-S cluster-containing protein|nr:4Fe-4S dicluster domain-containing protein [Peptococcaceae bacterium]
MDGAKAILKTLSAKCRDCYRCVRICPVKAIGIKDNQAYVDAKRCILCGTCVRECPQHAKIYRNDIESAAELVQAGKVIASVAPSFSAVYGSRKGQRLPSALRRLGFFKVAETAEGAKVVAQQTTKIMNSSSSEMSVCTACPAVVNYVEKYCPEHLDKLFPVVSPMIAHARLLKKIYGPDVSVVFIGPCLAKKQEAERPAYHGDVDVVLTFSELNQWLARENILLEDCPPDNFDNSIMPGYAKLFPLPGGMLKTMGIAQDGTQREIMHLSGMDNVKLLFELGNAFNDLEIVEPMMCSEGCINGLGINPEINLFERRANLINYAAGKIDLPAADINSESESKPLTDRPEEEHEFDDVDDLDDLDLDLTAVLTSEENIGEDFSEEQINQVFAMMDKEDPESRLNCGACGYSSCREKAKAVLRGMAGIEMCIPYMRKLAEQRADKIMDSSPSGIVILDEALNILAMNASFCDYFICGKHLIGRNISYLLDAQNFEKVATGVKEYTSAIVSCYGREFHQLVYRLYEENQYVGIYTDVTGMLVTEAKMEELKTQTIKKAQELLEHQIKVAQTMAKFLGESTARSEELVERLMGTNES